ncbi:MAG TPA: hypothetical protein VJI46_06075 [Candidatus Nanoarchaeia archaeon]|nr:hypothetical protein [Candidatus Nanoarchaeia archaeon]
MRKSKTNPLIGSHSGGKYIWKDKLLLAYALFLVFFSFSALILVLLLFYPNSYYSNNYLRALGFLLLGLPVWLVYSLLRLRFSYVTSKGIRVGNAYFKHGSDIVLKQKPVFLFWGDIKDIRVVNKEYPGNIYGSHLVHFLQVKTKHNESYECTLLDYKGFIGTVVRLKKTGLFSKKSRYINELEEVKTK